MRTADGADGSVEAPEPREDRAMSEVEKFGFELTDEVRSWVVNSQTTTDGLDNPHLIIVGKQRMYAETPRLSDERLAEIGSRRATAGLPPLPGRNAPEEVPYELPSKPVLFALGMIASDLMGRFATRLRSS